MADASVSLVIPAFDEEASIASVLEEAVAVLGRLGLPHEILVVDDCSTDRTAEIAEAAGVTVLRNVQNRGYGYSLIRGLRQAKHRIVAIVDADGSYPLARLPEMLELYRRGYAMVVGERRGPYYAGTLGMKLLRGIFRALVQFVVGGSVPDVNSGMRVFDRDVVRPLHPYLSTGFSFTTSITMFFIMQGLPVQYVPIEYRKRTGRSKVRYFRDALRGLQLVASITARLNPIKLFLLGALLNLAVMLPLLALLALWRPVSGLLVGVVEVSAAIASLGFVVDALVDKLAFESQTDYPERRP